MKKNLLFLFACLFTTGLWAQFPFFDNFESANAFSVPTGYAATGGPNVYLVHGVSGGKAFTAPRFTFSGMATITSPLIGPLSSDAILSFKWRAATAIASIYPVDAEPLGASDYINVGISTDGSNFTTISSLNSTNTTASTDFATVYVPLTGYSGQNVKVRFTINTTGHSNDFFIDFDDLSVGGTVVNCINDTDGDGVCDENEIAGCQDPLACNFNSAATDPGTCEYAQTYYNCNGECLNDTDGDGICNQLEIQGCQDQAACNYNPDATDNVGCVYVISLAISGDANPTINTTVQYSYPNNSGSTYNWTVVNGDIISGQGTATIVVSWNAAQGAGSVSVTETNSIGCVGATVSFSVTVVGSGIQGCTDPSACNYNPDATVNVGCTYLSVFSIQGTGNPVVNGAQASYSYPFNPGSTYVWQVTNGSIVSGQGTANIIVLWSETAVSGTLTVQETNADGCTGAVVEATQELIPNAVSEQSLSNIILAPNPANDKVCIQGQYNAGEKLNVYNVQGQLVMSKRCAVNETIQLSGLPSGIYMVQMNGMKPCRLVVEH